MNKIFKAVLLLVVLGFFGLAGFAYYQVKKHDEAEVFVQPDDLEEMVDLVLPPVIIPTSTPTPTPNPTPASATSQTPTSSQTDSQSTKPVATLESSGDFIKVDFVHYASGQARVYDTPEGPIMRFENFESAPGPDLFVYLSKNNPTKQADALGEFINLGVLKNIKGEQVYALPQNYKDYGSVVIWCRAFGVLFSSAPFHF